MHTHTNESEANKSRLAASIARNEQKGNLKEATHRQQREQNNEDSTEWVDDRPEVAQMKRLQALADESYRNQQLAQLREMAAKPVMEPPQPIPKKLHREPGQTANRTGLPDQLKAGIENLSGHDMNDVKVHYNSDKPAQLNAHAYAQGTDIHLGSGQEKHLPHEAWHVVQQKQGRVKPTFQVKGGVSINDDPGLEKEADTMGALSLKHAETPTNPLRHPTTSTSAYQLKANEEEYSSGQKELLRIVAELRKNKLTGSEVSEATKEEVMDAMLQVVHSGDDKVVGQVLKTVEQAAQHTVQQKVGETAQLSGWRFAGLIGGGLLGAVVGALAFGVGAIPGAYFGGKKGWKAGKKKDQKNRLLNSGATEQQLAAMLLIENNINVLVQQTLAETNQDAVRIHQLYVADGATSAQVTAMLAGEANAQVLHTQIQTEVTSSPTRIRQLYADGATSAQITAMLAIENDASIIDARIQAEANQQAAGIYQLYMDGATSAEMNTLLGHEANAQVLHQQLHTEANHSVGRILQLYADGTTSAQITTMLGVEPDAQVIHARIQAEANQSAAHISALYGRGATSAEIHQLLTIESNAATLLTQIQTEANQSIASLLELYDDGATGAEVTVLLAAENDATVLHAQIQAEAHTNPSRIRQLYVDQATSAQITAMLTTVNHPQTDARVIHEQLAASDAATIFGHYNAGRDSNWINQNLGPAALVPGTPHETTAPYASGATAPEITFILQVPGAPTPQVLATQIGNEAHQNPAQLHQLYRYGATAAEVTALLTFQPDARILDKQIQTEANHSVTSVLQLYADGATSAQVTTMLRVEPDAQTLHTQIQTETNASVTYIHHLYTARNVTSAELMTLLGHEPNAVKIHRLYRDGATTIEILALLALDPHAGNIHVLFAHGLNAAEVTALLTHHPNAQQLEQLFRAGANQVTIPRMLAREPNAAAIHTLIKREANQDPDSIYRLYHYDHATTAQLTSLLAIENDAVTLRAQIQAEATHSVANLLQLYNDGATEAEVTALLAVEPDAMVLHAQIQAEANTSADRILQLYTDHATSTQITAILTTVAHPQTDARVIHEQLAASDAATIYGHYNAGRDSNWINQNLGPAALVPGAPHETTAPYASGATAPEIAAILLVPGAPTPQVLDTQIGNEAHQNPAQLHRLYQYGATAADVTALLAFQNDARILNNQIQAEANQSVAAVRQLYADGATSDEINYVMKVEQAHDATRIHQLFTDGATYAQIIQLLDKYQNHNAQHLHALYGGGANTGQIFDLLEKEPGADQIAALIGLEAAPLTAGPRIHALYTTHEASTQQIQRMMAQENNAQTIVNQITTEANWSTRYIYRFYHTHHFTATQIDQLLALDPDGRGILQLLNRGASRAEILLMLNLDPNADFIDDLFARGLDAADVTALLNVHANAQKLEQLFRAGANRVTLPRMLAREPNAAAIHTLIKKEANQSADLMYRLYHYDLATTAQLTALLAIENNAVTLRAQIQAEATHSVANLLQLYNDGATGAEVTALLAAEPDATVLHAQIQAEANTNPSRIRQLYADHATSAQITAMLTTVAHPQTDARVIHEQLAASDAATIFGYYNTGRNSDWINQNLGPAALVPGTPHEATEPYASGATSPEIAAILLVPGAPTPQVLDTQIGNEAHQNPAQLHRLYQYGAAAAEVTALLTFQNDARILNLQIRTENANSPTRILQLYQDGVTSEELTGMLTVNADGNALHGILQTNTGAFNENNIWFVTVANGMIGSIYFPTGRIRLTHGHHPEISSHPTGIISSTISNADYQQYKQWKEGKGNRERYHFVSNLPSYTHPLIVGNGERLIEFFGTQGANGSHPSRGGPRAFAHAINALQFKILYYAASQGNNATLLSWREAIPALRAIPIRVM